MENVIVASVYAIMDGPMRIVVVVQTNPTALDLIVQVFVQVTAYVAAINVFVMTIHLEHFLPENFVNNFLMKVDHVKF